MYAGDQMGVSVCFAKYSLKNRLARLFGKTTAVFAKFPPLRLYRSAATCFKKLSILVDFFQFIIKYIPQITAHMSVSHVCQ